MKAPYASTVGRTPIALELNVSEDASNAVVWYKINVVGQGNESGKTITKEYVVGCKCSRCSLYRECKSVLLTARVSDSQAQVFRTRQDKSPNGYVLSRE